MRATTVLPRAALLGHSPLGAAFLSMEIVYLRPVGTVPEAGGRDSTANEGDGSEQDARPEGRPCGEMRVGDERDPHAWRAGDRL